MMGKLEKDDVKHTLVAFSIHSRTGVRIRNGLIYDVKGHTNNTNSPSLLTRSLTPKPRCSFPFDERNTETSRIPSTSLCF